MRMDRSGMRDCVFTLGDGQGLCPMQIADHVTDWRLLFGSIPQPVLLMVIFVVVLGMAVFGRLLMPPSLLLLRFLWYDRARVHQRIFMPLQLAFAGGKVQPKICA